MPFAIYFSYPVNPALNKYALFLGRIAYDIDNRCQRFRRDTVRLLRITNISQTVLIDVHIT